MRRPGPEARLRLFCFPHAGAGASAFIRWAMPAGIEVCGVELPGRGSRARAASGRATGELTRALAAGLRPFLDLPFAFFGHGMGALLALALAQHLVGAGRPGPRALLISGAAAPHLPRRRMSHLPDAELLAEIRASGGTPHDVVDDLASTTELFLPLLRDDLRLFETCRFARLPVPDCPVHLYGGDRDDLVSAAELAAWADVLPVTGTRLFPGNHFYLNDQREALTAAIADTLGALVGRPTEVR